MERICAAETCWAWLNKCQGLTPRTFTIDLTTMILYAPSTDGICSVFRTWALRWKNGIASNFLSLSGCTQADCWHYINSLDKINICLCKRQLIFSFSNVQLRRKFCSKLRQKTMQWTNFKYGRKSEGGDSYIVPKAWKQHDSGIQVLGDYALSGTPRFPWSWITMTCLAFYVITLHFQLAWSSNLKLCLISSVCLNESAEIRCHFWRFFFNVHPKSSNRSVTWVCN